jgi:hypothetical protein
MIQATTVKGAGYADGHKLDGGRRAEGSIEDGAAGSVAAGGGDRSRGRGNCNLYR